MDPLNLKIIKFARDMPSEVLEGEWDRQGGLAGFYEAVRRVARLSDDVDLHSISKKNYGTYNTGDH